jgi:hypothetical protein
MVSFAQNNHTKVSYLATTIKARLPKQEKKNGNNVVAS